MGRASNYRRIGLLAVVLIKACAEAAATSGIRRILAKGSPYGMCLVNNKPGVAGCTYDDGSQADNTKWRDCIHDVSQRCGGLGSTSSLTAKPNVNSGCPNCVLWACAQNPQLALVINGQAFDFTVNKTCLTNKLIYNAPSGGMPGYTIFRGPVPTYNWDHFLAVPSKPVWGVDDPNKASFDLLWDKAWAQRSWTKVDLGNWAAAINNRRARGQQQMHIHSGKLVPGNRARIDAITPTTKSINLLTDNGQQVVATIVSRDASASQPSVLKPFSGFFTVNKAPPLTASNPGADHALVIAAGPRNAGFILLDIGLAPVDGPSGIMVKA